MAKSLDMGSNLEKRVIPQSLKSTTPRISPIGRLSQKQPEMWGVQTFRLFGLDPLQHTALKFTPRQLAGMRPAVLPVEGPSPWWQTIFPAIRQPKAPQRPDLWRRAYGAAQPQIRNMAAGGDKIAFGIFDPVSGQRKIFVISKTEIPNVQNRQQLLEYLRQKAQPWLQTVRQQALLEKARERLQFLEQQHYKLQQIAAEETKTKQQPQPQPQQKAPRQQQRPQKRQAPRQQPIYQPGRHTVKNFKRGLDIGLNPFNQQRMLRTGQLHPDVAVAVRTIRSMNRLGNLPEKYREDAKKLLQFIRNFNMRHGTTY